ncbi:cytochrome C biogenesis protein CcdA [Paenibacillus montaniterrae]|uniref:Cytochrome C biogenesis protein CcdA n=1 Tax=Paenibacillus montaniterrae TaxID=429341 RepID=A0A920CSY3_9BACL|nr:cytochrome c biogenesis protein CcdA [Paenibacillus montaniterrae]GIP15277.1 cytochrome C biogenesis protein CcdA [Paenibacillus montaniterrae]
MNEVTLWIAFAAGIASFISPCCLPLYPSYLSYITGISVSELTSSEVQGKNRWLMLSHTLFFILGFSTVYYALAYGANAFSELFQEYSGLVRRLSAILIILMGLFLLGIFQPRLLMKEARFNLIPKKTSYVGSYIFGLGFSAGWTPCMGPALTAIMGMAAAQPGTWFSLTTAYALGFAIPFFVMAFFLGSSRWILKYSNRIMKLGGAVMILMGILLFTDQMTKITVWLNMITPDWLKF